MKIDYYLPKWGMNDWQSDDVLSRAKSADYDGVEWFIDYNERDQNKRTAEAESVAESAAKFDLKICGQVIDFNVRFNDETVADFARNLDDTARMNPVKLNIHLGREYYGFEQNSRLINIALEWSEKTNIPVCFETHRNRFSFAAVTTQPYFDRFPTMKVTFDISHWIVASESYLEEQEEFVARAIERTAHLHARVGHTESPQVAHPNAPENKFAFDKHLGWWDEIIAKHAAENAEILTIATEFGPVPYMPVAPFTNEPLGDQFEINVWMQKFLRERYSNNT